ncbi:VOC family protein [Herbiconiux liangxiaofengii]|uniref:VOC family protein n=1 Tax=Herbiconiux liangxiaofengii TaxID=3342795 RepID=UPI0035B9175D
MALRFEQIVVDASDPKALAAWWQEALGWELTFASDDTDDDPEYEIAPDGQSHPSLLFLHVPEAKTVKNRLHFDFVPDDQAAEVARLEALGATRTEVGQQDVTWVVLADPEGNEFCILSAR